MSEHHRPVRIDTFLVLYQDGEIVGVARTIRGRAEKMIAESDGGWRIVNEMEFDKARQIVREKSGNVW